MPKAYPESFRREVVDAARSTSGPLSHIATSYGISESCLHKWLQNDAKTRSGGDDQAAKAESAELKALRAKLREKDMEIEVLRRAAAYFARDVLPK